MSLITLPIRVLSVLLCYVWYHELGFGVCLDKRCALTNAERAEYQELENPVGDVPFI